MHIVTILAYALLFWRATAPNGGSKPAAFSPTLTLLLAIGLPFSLWLASSAVAHRGQRLLQHRAPGRGPGPEQFYHRAFFALRIALIGGFVGLLVLTPWLEWFRFGEVTPWLQIVGDLLALLPFFLGGVAIWLGSFSVERTIRMLGRRALGLCSAAAEWSLRSYLDFNIRHHLLVVAVPMTLILFAADVAYGYERALRSATDWVWTPDVLVGAAAGAVFLISPVILRRIWRTETLADGPLRGRLQALCGRIGLRVRDILVWQSDGLMINAAVMGVFPQIRYVLLSDALLSTMTPQQVEAVFGHEAGHVRHHHIPHFLTFALIGWMGTAAGMELLAGAVSWASADPGRWILEIQAAGVVATLLFWGIGFGWLSRRFERQADVFAAQCAAPPPDECRQPCSLHLAGRSEDHQVGRVCSTGAMVFASALESVAVLSGIPPEEPSWRHSSIASRVRFLLSLANDPSRALRFDRLIRRIKALMVITALVGGAGSAYYWLTVPRPALLHIQARSR